MIKDRIQRLYAQAVNVIYAAVAIILLLLVGWGISWFSDRQWQAPFEAQLVTAGYDPQIVGLTRYKLLEKVYLMDASEPDVPSVKPVPIHSDDAIITLANGERVVFISAALPHLFTDVTSWARNVNCIQAKARTRLENGGYTAYEELFWLTYTHTVARESRADFEERLATLDNQEQITRERVKYVYNRAYINSNSALMKGTCVGELGGWLKN